MPLYEFRCACGSDTEQIHAMSAVPASIVCPACEQDSARRIVGSPRLSHAGSSAYRLIDSAARSAHEPDVVGGIPGRRRSTPVTTHPLHRRLPRP